MGNHRLTKRRSIVGATASLGLIAAGVTYMLSSTAMAGPTPNSYTYYSFPSGTPALHDVTWTSTPQLDPGYTANIFWSHQFSFDNQHGGYFGMQSNGGDKRRFLYSVWDATESKPGPTSVCEPFGGEGDGQHCFALLDWQAGHTYKFTIAPAGDPGWFAATVTDDTTHTSVTVGSIKSGGATGISPSGLIDWTEYFEWSSSASNCFNQPAAAVAFGVPRGNGGSVVAKIDDVKASDGDCRAKIDVTPDNSVQRGAIGNTTRGPVRNNGQKCLSAPADPAVETADCSDARAQAWVYAADGTLRLRWDSCLAVQGDAVISQACQGAAPEGRVGTPAKLWTYDAATQTLKNRQSGRCLTVGADGRPTTETCAGTPAQKWTLPPSGTSTAPTPGPTPTPVPTPPPGKPTNRTVPLTSLSWNRATGGWGPVERNTSNGERGAGDGHPMSIRGAAYAQGIGTHAASTVEYNLGRTCKTLTVDVGVDDETRGGGSVDFKIYRDKTKVADSGVVTGKSPVKHLTADLTDGTTLRLVVTDGGDGSGWDHADWANPQISCS
ncbi:NPCBM/NEW2 domain-containing protein [Yinghuangia seranimata]|uniref:NPCBM/NEW2 domain-containing protein n=1 Tax=Yinghuangia seranimata TaxID=408067 RepID=UPI00248D21FB|nr:NPCBM/NEW2 domain-containing protein [Yinghuangia seranimata]MDI2128867.1 NPCBM/NEW2 domain-containing protein [Yinghuangia seranimata]